MSMNALPKNVLPKKMSSFDFDGKPIRFITYENGNWDAVAQDVAESLGYSWRVAVMKHIPNELKGVIRCNTLDGNQKILTQKLLTLTEQGLQFFLRRSDKPKALLFERWVYNEVRSKITTNSTNHVISPKIVPPKVVAFLPTMVEGIMRVLFDEPEGGFTKEVVLSYVLENGAPWNRIISKICNQDLLCLEAWLERSATLELEAKYKERILNQKVDCAKAELLTHLKSAKEKFKDLNYVDFADKEPKLVEALKYINVFLNETEPTKPVEPTDK